MSNIVFMTFVELCGKKKYNRINTKPTIPFDTQFYNMINNTVTLFMIDTKSYLVSHVGYICIPADSVTRIIQYKLTEG